LNKLQKAFWLAKKNFIRGVFANISSVVLLAVSNSVLFFFILLKINSSDTLTIDFMLPTLFAFILLFIVFISLLAIYALNIKVRYHEIALLKGIGAEKNFIKMMLFSEIGFLSIVSIIISVLLIILSFVFFGRTIFLYIKPLVESGGLSSVVFAGIFSIGINFALAFLSVVLPIGMVSRIEPYFAIRKRE